MVLGGGGGRQNSGVSLVFCLLWGPRGAFLEVAVDKIQAFCFVFVYFRSRAGRFWRRQYAKFRHFARFFSTSRTARGLFEGGGRQNFGISLVFCLLRGRAISSHQRTAFHKKTAETIDCFLNRFLEPLYKE